MAAYSLGRSESIELLLKYDPDAASKEMNDEYQRLPLHLVCVVVDIIRPSVKYNFCTMHIQKQYLLGMNMEIHQLTMHAHREIQLSSTS